MTTHLLSLLLGLCITLTAVICKESICGLSTTKLYSKTYTQMQDKYVQPVKILYSFSRESASILEFEAVVTLYPTTFTTKGQHSYKQWIGAGFCGTTDNSTSHELALDSQSDSVVYFNDCRLVRFQEEVSDYASFRETRITNGPVYFVLVVYNSIFPALTKPYGVVYNVSLTPHRVDSECKTVALLNRSGHIVLGCIIVAHVALSSLVTAVLVILQMKRSIRARTYSFIIGMPCVIICSFVYLAIYVYDFVALRHYYDFARMTRTNLSMKYVVAFKVVELVVFSIGNGAYSYKIFRFFQLRWLYAMFYKTNHRIKNQKMQEILASHGLCIASTAFLPIANILAAVILTERTFDSDGHEATIRALEVLFDISVYGTQMIVLAGLIMDAIANYHTIRANGIKGHFSEDPLLYRIEATIGVIASLIMLPVFFLQLISTFNNYISENGQAVLQLIFHMLTVVILHMTIGCGIVTYIELFRMGKSRINTATDNKNADMLALLEDVTFVKLFQDYCLREMALENLLLIKVLKPAFEKGSISAGQFQSIFDEYIGSRANVEINIPARTNRICKNLAAKYTDPSKSIPVDEWKRLYYDVMDNLADTFTRYSVTEEHRRWRLMRNPENIMTTIETDLSGQLNPQRKERIASTIKSL